MASAIIAIGAAIAGSTVAALPVIAGLGAAAASAIGAVVSFGIQYLGNKLLGTSEKPPGASRSQLQQNLESGVLVNVTNTDSPIPVVVGTRRVGGIRIFGPRVYGNGNSHAAGVFVWSEGLIADIPELYADDLAVSDSFWQAGSIETVNYLGSDGQAGDAALEADVPEWTAADHAVPGAAYTVARFKYNRDQFPNGFPTLTADISGVMVFDPRDSTVKASSNPALIIRHYLTNTRYGRGYDTGILDDDSFIAAANYCDQVVTVPDGAGGTVSQARYTCDGVIDTTKDPLPIMNELLAACRGYLVWSAGKYKLVIDQAGASVFTFTRDHIVGGLTIHGLEKRKIFNRVHCRFFDKTQDYKPNFATADSAAFRSEDGGKLLESTIDLHFVTDYYRALAVAWMEMKRSRQSLLVTFEAVLEGLRCEVGDVVAVTHPTPAWESKLFRVMRVAPKESHNVEVTLVEYDSTVYDALTLDERSNSPNTTLPDPRFPGTPGTPSVSESTYVTRQNLVKAKADVTWVAADDVFMYQYVVEHRLTGATEWIASSPIRADGRESTGGTYTHELLDLAPGNYDVRVTGFNRFDVDSSSTAATFELIGLAAPPAAPANVTVAAAGNTAVITFDPSTDLDVTHGGKVHVLHSRLQSSATLADAVSIGRGPDPGTATVVGRPLLPGTYFVVFEDAGGVRSDPGSASTKGAQVLAYSTAAVIQEHPSFPGTPVNVAAGGGQLKLSNLTNVDDYGLVDSITDWDSEGGINTSGTYTFSAGIDLGSVKRVRLRLELTSTIENPLDTIDARTADIDTWTDIDGQFNGQADVRVFVRETDDDPNGSPTWSAWQQLHAGEFELRGAEFYAELSTQDSTYNVIVTELAVRAEEI